MIGRNDQVANSAGLKPRICKVLGCSLITFRFDLQGEWLRHERHRRFGDSVFTN